MSEDQKIRDLKGDLAVAYVRAIAARCNCTFIESTWAEDKIGFDCTIINYQAGTKPKFFNPGNEIKIQVKGTSISSPSMYEDKGDVIRYKTDEIIPTSILFYLVVLVLPEEQNIDSWLKVTPDSLTLKRCAYYVKIEGRQPAGFIEIPKTKLFTPESLLGMFINSVGELIK